MHVCRMQHAVRRLVGTLVDSLLPLVFMVSQSPQFDACGILCRMCASAFARHSAYSWSVTPLALDFVGVVGLLLSSVVTTQTRTTTTKTKVKLVSASAGS